MVGSVSSKEVVFCFQLIRNTRGASRQCLVQGAGIVILMTNIFLVSSRACNLGTTH